MTAGPALSSSLSRRQLLRGIAAASAAIHTAPAQTRHPNVLIILADEWRAQATRYNGDTNVQTPVLDRFATQSMSFDRAVSGTPVCCPARASLLTGQYPLTHGVFINDVELKPKAPTLAEVFAKAGYRTGYIGKWHVYGSPDGNYGRRLAYIPPDHRFGFQEWKACECTHDYNKSLYYEGNDPTPKYWPGYDAFAQTFAASDFIRRSTKEQNPFLLYLSWGPPHFPYPTAPQQDRDRFADSPIALRKNVPAAQQAQATEILRGYYAHMSALDRCFDHLFKTLKEIRADKDTIVLFTSDHGDMMLSQGLTTKLYPWDESIRIPFLLKDPRRPRSQGQRVNATANLCDVMPTLLSLAGLPVPGAVEGQDLTPVLDGKHAPSECSLTSLPVPITEARKYGFAAYRGVRTEQHTYVRSAKGPWLMYDNESDPYQMRNLVADTGSSETRKRLDALLDAQLKLRKDGFLPAEEYVRRIGAGHYREVNVPVGHTTSPWNDWSSTASQ